MSIPIISIVGRKNSGKTTFIAKLIPCLEDRGLRVACVKQHKHDVPVDVVGKDSWIFAQAGASCSIMSTYRQLSLVYQRDRMEELDELAEIAVKSNCDILIGESFNNSPDMEGVDRCVIARRERTEAPRFSPEESFCVITDDLEFIDSWREAGKFAFDINEVDDFADFLCEYYNLPQIPKLVSEDTLVN